MRTLIKILYFLAGVDCDAIKEASNKEKNSYLILGVAVLIPAVMAWFGMYHQIYWIGYEGFYRIGICTLWSFIILTVDILMVNTMIRPENMFTKKTSGDTIVYFGKATFRLLLSIILGYFISQPLIIKHYEKEIEQELVYIKKDKQDKLDYKNEALIKHFTHKDSLKLNELEAEKKCLEFLQSCEKIGKDTILSCGGTSKIRGEGFRFDLLKTRLTDVTKKIKDISLTLDNINAAKNKTNQILSDSLEKNYSKGYAIRQLALDNIEKNLGGSNVASRHNWLLILLIFLDSTAIIMKILMPYGVHDKKLAEIKNRNIGEIEATINLDDSNINSINDEISVTKAKDDKIKNITIDAINLNGGTSYTPSDVYNRLKAFKLHKYEINEYWRDYVRKELQTVNEKKKTNEVVSTSKEISGRSKDIVSALLSVILLLLLVYKVQSNDIEWFATWGVVFPAAYTAIIEIIRFFKR